MNVSYIKQSTDDKPFLSVCICTIESRKQTFDNLCRILLDYSNYYNVEILSLCDNKEITVGKKRNLLVLACKGQFISFIDDDDIVAPCYFEKIYEATKFFPDVIGIEGVYTENGINPRNFSHSLKYNTWFERADGLLCRCPNHLNPIRSDLVKRIKFPEKNFGEDKDFSLNIYPLLKNEVYINTPIYFYLYNQNKSETKGR